MPKGKKKRKQRREMPPLPLLDKIFYWLAAALMAAAFIGLILLWLSWAEWVMFVDPEVVAGRSHMSFLWAFPAVFCLFATGLGFWCWGYNGRYPIFGIKGFHYGPPLPRIYPMLAKDRPPRKPADRRGARRLAAVVLTINLICLAPVPLSVAGRDSLKADGTVQEFSMFGNVREEYTVRDTERVTLSVYSYTSGKSSFTRHWAVSLELQMTDGSRYEFPSGCFRRDGNGGHRWVRELEQVLEHYPAQSIGIQNAEELDRVVQDHQLTAEEAGILYRLFRYTK